MDAAHHAAVLQKICRVCGESLTRAFRVHYECAETKHAKKLMKVFGIDVSRDDHSVHPHNLCHKCQNVIYTSNKRAEGRDYTNEGCSVCQHISVVQRGGARKIKVGRPAEVCYQSAIRHIRSIAPPSFFPDANSRSYTAGDSPVTISDLECPTCTNVLDRPIELITCGSHVCADQYSLMSVLLRRSLPHNLQHSARIQSGPEACGGLQTVCRECNRMVKVADYRTQL